MKPTKQATLKQDGNWLTLATPYSADLVADLKDAVPWQEREWDGQARVWKVRPAHLDAVRTLLTQYSADEGWDLADHTAQSATEIAEAQTAQEASFLDAHVAAVQAVLPKLPARALSLIRWKPGEPGELHLELLAFLDNEALFHELQQASLAAYRPTWLLPWTKGTGRFTLVLADDDRILRALAAYARHSSQSSANVDHLRVPNLHVVATYPDGVVHLAEPGSDEPTWAGAPYRTVAVEERNVGGTPWDLAVTEQGIYLVWERAALVDNWLGEPTHGVFYFGGFFGVAGPDNPSGLERVLQMLHFESWFHAYGNALVAGDTVTKRRWSLDQAGWIVENWEHPADRLIEYLARRQLLIRAGLLAILGWAQADVAAQRTRIAVLKEARATAQRATDQAQAGTLARPQLEALTKAELSTLAERHGVALKKSAGKAEMVATLADTPAVALDIIGLAQYIKEG